MSVLFAEDIVDKLNFTISIDSEMNKIEVPPNEVLFFDSYFHYNFSNLFILRFSSPQEFFVRFLEVENENIKHVALIHILGMRAQLLSHFPLHSSAVILNSKVNLFSGKSGSGKSTLASELAKRGLDFGGDEMCVLKLLNDGLFMRPYFKAAHIGKSLIQKEWISLTNKSYVENLPIHRVFFVEKAEEYSVVKLSSRQVIPSLLFNHFKPYLVNDIEGKKKRFEFALELVRRVDFYKLLWPHNNNEESYKRLIEFLND